MNYIKFEFELTDPAQSDLLVALLSEQDFNGFEETNDNLTAFISEEIFNEVSFKDSLQLFSLLPYKKSIVENINWNKQWEESFEPVLAGDFAGVRADFHQPITTVAHEIIITPKMSFGTGHHATTYLVIQQMEFIDFIGKKVLDFGTGTGILAILAERLGAAEISAIDIDEWSITNTIENIRRNNCTKITAEQNDQIPVLIKYDIILANINLNVIIANLAAIKAVAAKGCTILLSGFLKENENEMMAAIEKFGFQHILTVQKGQWIAMKIFK